MRISDKELALYKHAEEQARDMINEGCPNNFFFSDLTDKEYYSEYYAGVMTPIGLNYRIEAADGYFNEDYMERIRDFEAITADPMSKWHIINHWFSKSKNSYVYIAEHLFTKQRKYVVNNCVRSKLNIMYDSCLLASCIWEESNELRALSKLKTHLDVKQYNAYFISGQFVEQSKKSGVYYIFRRNRPTIAMGLDSEAGWKFLAGLCSHPVGYYVNSWCGGLVPTDEIIAHVLMMRADEHGFWKKSNQHPEYSPVINL